MRHLTFKILAASLLALSIPAWSQTCQGHDEIPEQVRSAIESTAQQTYDQAARGDVNSLIIQEVFR